jgi:hypothetical protein
VALTELAHCSVCGGEHPVATMVTGHHEPEEVPAGARGEEPEPAGWALDDAEALHAEHPRSFFIPREERRQALRPGELVRLGFTYGPHADREGEGHTERMWVEVVEQAADGTTRGVLRNTPARFTALEIGDRVAFEPRHVLSIDFSDDELGYAQDQWPIVDESVLREDRPPDVVVRGPSPYEEGAEEWWMMRREAGAGPVSERVALLTDHFPGLEEPMRAGEGAWELASGTGVDARWRRVGDAELAASESWQRLYAWLPDAARHMREAAAAEAERPPDA